MSLTPPARDDDPRLASMDEEFRALAAEMVRGFRAMSGARKKRVFHPTSTTVAGSLTVLPMPGAPRNAFFEPGRVLPLIIRFANGVQEDDAAWDNRGATLRVLSPERPDRLDRGLLDLLLTTGCTFSSRAARDFRAWMLGDRSAREAMVRVHPRFGVAAWEMFRAIDSYTDVHYFTKVVQSYVDTEGEGFLCRFRLRDPRRLEDAGFLDDGGALLPPDRTSRAPGDARPRTFLHDELRRRVGGEGVDLLLELQVRGVPVDPAERDDAVDASRTWTEDSHPWHEAGRIHLHRVVANPQVESLAFNPVNAPRELAMLHGRTADDPASLNHLRSIVYEVAAAARLGKEPSAALAPLLVPPVGAKVKPTTQPSAPVRAPAPAPAVPSTRRPRTRALKVAVIGGGVSGLTVARELTTAGAAVTVFERADEVGGKAASVEIGGHVFDLGAHLCSAAYEQLAALLEELGIERDDVSPVILYDIEANAPRTTFADVNAEFLRYHGQVRPHLKSILDPGFERHEARFSAPLAKWAASEGIETLVAATAIGYTASGYGHPSDPELPALYFLKYAETATFCMDPGTLRYWTPRGGFGNVWKRVADELPDVRCGAEIEAVERDAEGVRVRVGGVTHRFDRLVVAAPLHEVSDWLELSAEEAELFSQIRLLDYATVIVSAEGLPRDGFFLVKNHCEDLGNVGHAVAFHHRHPDSDVYLFWAYLEEGMTDEALLGCLGEDAARLGGRVTTVHAVHHWRYFPHVSPAAMDAGFYRRAAAMQGRQHTFYVGSLFNFELVDCNMRHARAIARAVMQEEAAAPVEAQRRAPATSAPPVTTTFSAPADVDELVGYLLRIAREEVGADGEALGPDDELRRLGLDSLRSIQLLERVSRELDLVLAPILFFEHPTPRALARHLASEMERQHRSGARRVPVAQSAAASSISHREEELLAYLEGVVREGLNLATLPIMPDDELPSLGLDSVTSVQIFDRICHDLKLELTPILFFEHPTLRALAAYLASEVVRQHGVAADDEPRAAARSRTEPAPSPSHAATPPLEARLSRIEDAIARLTGLVQQRAPASPSSPPAAEVAAPAHSPAPADAERALVATASPWILRAAATERPWHRLIAFHPAGEDARTYARWPAHLPAGVEFCAVELPGRSAHWARPMTDHAELMERLVHELWPLVEELPYSLFGHSFGALLAYEVTRRFERRGRGPTRLFVSSFVAPAHAHAPNLPHLGGLRLSPALWADQRVVHSWNYEPDQVQAPIAIFHGQDDTMFRRDEVERWAEATTGRTVLHVNAGGHFHLLDGALVPGLVGAHLLADRSPRPTAGDEDTVAPHHPEPVAEPGVEATAAGEALLRALDRQFGDRCVTSGSWNLYDLAWIARAHAEPEGRGGPAFPEALRVLLSRLEPDGSFGALASPVPQTAFMISLVAANTLLQWNGLEGRDFGPLIEALLEQAERASERMKDRRYLGLEMPYGRLYKFPGLLGHSMIPSNECALLLRQGGRFLAPARQQWLRSHVRDADVAFGEDHFKRGSWLIGYGEYFPAELVRSPSAREHAENAAPALPGHSAAFATRYFDETRSEKVRASIEAVLAHAETGLRPHGRLQEVYFALHYLAKTGLDLALLCPGMIRYFQSAQRKYGVAIDDAGLAIDIDSTAIALYLSERLGLDVPIERGERILDSMWDEARECYRNTLGAFPSVNITVMVLRAYLEMRSVPWERKREIWRRTIRLLESRSWMVIEHLSPFYAWEGVISVFFEHEHLFPDDRTTAHHEALAELLRQQAPSGGFHSFYLAEPSLEETGYALLALKAAARGRLAPERRRDVMAALGRAQAFLEQSWCDTRRSGHTVIHPELWIGKAMFTSVNLVDAVIAAALLAPPASAQLVLDGGVTAEEAPDRGTGISEDFGRLYRLATLLRPGALAESMRTVDQRMDARPIRRGTEISPLRNHNNGGAGALPSTYVHGGRSSSIETFLERTGTTGLIVLRGDTILFERYYQGTTAASRTIGWSLSKSVVSALIGVAVGEGLIRDIHEPVSLYVPKLVGSGFDGVSIKDVLQMSSGVRVEKDEGGGGMTKLRRFPALLTRGPLDDVVAALPSERPPGTYHRYHAANTQVLGMVLRAVAGRPIAQYAEEKLWGPVGMEADASWLVDGAGIELASIGLSAVLRDQARFGLLYLRNGRAQDRQILTEQWVRASVTPDAAHLVPGQNDLSDWAEGYGYHWWIPEQPDGDFFTMGAYCQAIYVSPRHDIVIARSAAYEDYSKDADQIEREAVEVYKAISRNIG